MTKKERRRQEWLARVADYQASGQTMKAWSEANHASKDQLMYWLRRLQSSATTSIIGSVRASWYVFSSR